MTHEMPSNYGETMAHEPQLLLLTSLGEHNQGTIGPKGTAEEAQAFSEYMAREAARPEYSKPPTNRWVCVDGRVSAAKMQEIDNEKADPQTAGGLPLTELSVEFMLDKAPAPVSVTLAQTTQKTISNGRKAVIHGDTHAHKAGCGCNAKQDDILKLNAANIDIVTPIAWDFAKHFEIDKHMAIEDITDMIVTGGNNASNAALWDVTPEQKVDIVLANGGEYEELIEEHTESTTRVDASENAFDEAAFIRDHTDEAGVALRAFGASFGLLKKYYFDQVEEGGTSLHDASLRTMAAWLHNLGTAKQLSDDAMQAGIYA